MLLRLWQKRHQHPSGRHQRPSRRQRHQRAGVTPPGWGQRRPHFSRPCCSKHPRLPLRPLQGKAERVKERSEGHGVKFSTLCRPAAPVWS